jgi:hypothetical protein
MKCRAICIDFRHQSPPSPAVAQALPVIDNNSGLIHPAAGKLRRRAGDARTVCIIFSNDVQLLYFAVVMS